VIKNSPGRRRDFRVKMWGTFFATHPNSEDTLRRIFTLRLATVRGDGEPTRRRALRSEFSDEEWQLVSELADYPNRLLVTATTEAGETYAEAAHEAIFRRWDKLREWIAAEREFLAWRSGLDIARRAWQATPDGSKSDALLMGFALTQAQSWLATRSEDLHVIDREFIDQSVERKSKTRRRVQLTQALIYVLLLGVIAGLLGWINEEYLKKQIKWYFTTRPYMLAQVRPFVLTTQAESEVKPLQSFKECAKDCPEMIVIPAGSFMMGSRATEKGHQSREEPQHIVTITKPFAVSKFALTFNDWDACAAFGDCDPHIDDGGFGRGRLPVINVTWYDAQKYVAWLSQMTGKRYRLLSESEYEYAARAGTQSAYPWGEDIGTGNANCEGCGSQWDNKPAPVGTFAANQFGLCDMVGNVWEWVEDCWHTNYDGAPADGSPWLEGGNCTLRVDRGSSWGYPESPRSALRDRDATGNHDAIVGFRVGRTLTP